MKMLTIKDMAKELGMSRERLSLILRGKVKLKNIETAKRIEEVSKGLFKVTDLIPELKDYIDETRLEDKVAQFRKRLKKRDVSDEPS